jgi:hypothetical protein
MAQQPRVNPDAIVFTTSLFDLDFYQGISKEIRKF